jgi:DNA repair photolyase
LTGFAVHEITCKSLLNRSGISGIDYTVNPFTGCLHGCVYCYARFMARHTKHRMAWGDFCDVKTNALDVLEREVRKRPPGLVSLSTVTDPYQGPEQKYGLTRQILSRLREAGFPVSILTKSDLVLRDIDILQKFPTENLDVGYSINTDDDEIGSVFEPGAPAPSRRIEALRRLHDQGIRTWVFVAPFLPLLTDSHLEKMVGNFRGCVDETLFDSLNIKCGNWKGIENALEKIEPVLLPQWKRLLFDPVQKAENHRRILGRLQDLCLDAGIRIRA